MPSFLGFLSAVFFIGIVLALPICIIGSVARAIQMVVRRRDG